MFWIGMSQITYTLDNFEKWSARNNLVIASTHIPQKVDYALIALCT
jgi:hypothetical protein